MVIINWFVKLYKKVATQKLTLFFIFIFSFHHLYCSFLSSQALSMTDPAVKRVVCDIIKSPEDKRVYRGLEFTNGLKAVLISDPTTDKSSAALDVHIGRLACFSLPV